MNLLNYLKNSKREKIINKKKINYPKKREYSSNIN